MRMPKFKFNKETVCRHCARFSFLLLVVSLSFQVVTTNRYAVKGGEMVVLLDAKALLEKDVSLLKLEISAVSSLAYLEKQALQLGFVEYTDSMEIISSSQFAAVSDY